MTLDKTYREMEKELHEEYKRKLKDLKKVRAEKESVAQVFTKGILPLYIYYILSLSPSNGNDIATQISTHTDGKWTPSTGGIYPLLKKMEKEGFITCELTDEGRVQKIYTLTEEGRCEYQKKKELLKDKIYSAMEVFKIISKEMYES